MKLTSLFSILIAFALMFCSCQKEIDGTISGSDSTKTSNPFLVKRYVEDVYAVSAPDEHSIDSFKLSYDDKDRLLSLVSYDSVSGNKFIYHYDSDGYFTMDLYSGNAVSVHEILYLNSFSYVDSTLQYNDTQDTTTEKYVYNADKQLVQINEYDYSMATGSVLSGTTYYGYDNSGNVISETADDAVTTFAYSNSTVNSLNIGLNYYKQPKYLPDSFTYTSDFYTDSGTHTYTFDSQNRLTSDKAVLASGSVAEKRYYY